MSNSNTQSNVTERSGPKAFDSAYPGSMVERHDGYYICRNDHVSLAAALVELIASRDREIDDLRSALKQVRGGA